MPPSTTLPEDNASYKPLISFHLFPLLPTELRLQIWNIAYRQPRLLTLEFDRSDSTKDYIIDRSSSPQLPSWSDFWANDKITAGFLPLRESVTNTPLVACVNQESWEITRELDDFCFATRAPKGAVLYRLTSLPGNEELVELVPHTEITKPGFRFRPTYDTIYLKSPQTSKARQHTPQRHALSDEVRLHNIQRLAFNIGLGESEAAIKLHIWGFDQYKNLQDFIFVVEIEDNDRLREQLESLQRQGFGWPVFEDEHLTNTTRLFPRTETDIKIIFDHFKTYLLRQINDTIMSYKINRTPGDDLDRFNGEALGTSMARHEALLNQPRTYKLMTRSMLEDYAAGITDVVPILELRNRPGYLDFFSENILGQRDVVIIAGTEQSAPEIPV